MTLRLLFSGTDAQLATPVADEDSSAWKVLPYPQTFNNTIPSPSAWWTDEIAPAAFDTDYERNGQVFAVRMGTPRNRNALLPWGFDFDAAPSAAPPSTGTVGDGPLRWLRWGRPFMWMHWHLPPSN